MMKCHIGGEREVREGEEGGEGRREEKRGEGGRENISDYFKTFTCHHYLGIILLILI